MDKPNILFIMDDQHRFDWLGAAGADFVRTPNLDRLAARGTRFTQCVTNCPVCAPARIGLASGLQPFRLGSLDNNSILPRTTTTYYQRLRDADYRVACVGKLDLAKPLSYNGINGDRPYNFIWGFTHPEECEGKMHAGSFPEPVGPYTKYLQDRGLLRQFHDDYCARSKNGWIKNACHDSVLPTEDFEDAYIGRRAAEWLRNIPMDFPWHMFVSFVGPHDPFDPPAEYAERWRNAEMPPAIPAQPQGKPQLYRKKNRNMEPTEIMQARRQYAAAIELIDDQIGMIIAAVEERGLLDNTIIIFASDHGEMLGDHGLFTKSVPYEASIRVPLLISGPGLPEGQVSDALVELIDVNPTICELAGLPVQENIDALSLLPVINEPLRTHRTDTLSVIRGFECLRTAQYKFVNHHSDLELYDLENDPQEQYNIAPEHPEIVKDMGQRLRERFCENLWMH